MTHPRDIRDRLPGAQATDFAKGRLRWAPVKSLWFTANCLIAVLAGPLTISWSAVGVWLALSMLTLCGGHSLGMHRKLIHNSFDCPRWLELWGVHLACLVGLGGPVTMMRAHDVRDMAQRQDDCHPFYSQHDHILRDLWRQMHCRFEPEVPPVLALPDGVRHSRAMIVLQHTSVLQNVILGAVLFAIGGWAWVVWGVCVRVSVSMMGHSLVGWFAHNRGHRDWHRAEAGVQGHNVRWMSLVSFGESYHNNHHAFPESADFGLMPGQWDAGHWVLRQLERIGLVWNIRVAEMGADECAPTRITGNVRAGEAGGVSLRNDQSVPIPLSRPATSRPVQAS